MNLLPAYCKIDGYQIIILIIIILKNKLKNNNKNNIPSPPYCPFHGQ